MKSKFAAVILVILLLIPTAIAVISYTRAENAPLTDAVIDTISISDLDGKTFNLTKDGPSEEAKEMFDSFLDANKRATKVVGGLPEPLIGTKFFAVSFYGLEKTLNCQYYFKEDTNVAYYLNNDAETFLLPEDFVSKFQNSSYAISLYDRAVPPTMTLGGKFDVAPASMNWKYKLADGTYSTNTKPVPGETASDSYFIDGGLDVGFSRQPDTVNVKVFKGSELVYDGEYSEIGELQFEEKTAVSIELAASWFEDAERDCCGDAAYKFSAEIAAPAEFLLSKNEIDPGDFVVLTVKNVSDVSRLSCTAEPDIGYTPVFFQEGDVARTLVPFSYELEAGDYSLTASYGATSDQFTVKVKEKKFKTAPSVGITAETEHEKRTEQTIAAFEDEVRGVATSGDSNIYFRDKGAFYDYTNIGYPIQAGIGVNKQISATGTTYRHNGVDFRVDPGKDVAAVMDGRVVYVGETTLSGKLVIVEHGLGLKSWYAHLDSYSVSVGDSVTTGTVIAKTGKTGFTNGSTLHLGLTVFDVPVSIYPLWEKEGLVLEPPTPPTDEPASAE